MKTQKTTLIKPKKKKQKEKQKTEFLVPILMLLIGIILFTDSSKAVIVVCYTIGAIAIVFGIYHLISYYRLKQELNIEDNTKLITGVCIIFIGVIVIILSGAIETFLRFVLGFTLLVNGVKKGAIALHSHEKLNLIEGILFIGIGLYTILAENIIFQIVGLLLITASIFDFIKSFKIKNKA